MNTHLPRILACTGTAFAALLHAADAPLAAPKRTNTGSNRSAAPVIRSVRPSRNAPRSFDVVEIAVDLVATWDNPFDPDDVRLDADAAGPGDQRLRVPGFFMAPVERSGRAEHPQPPKPRGQWMLRIAFPSTGRWTVRISARDRNGTTQARPIEFDVAPGVREGYVRTAPTNPKYFAFDSGKPYVPIGVNLFTSVRLGAPPPPDRLQRCVRIMRKLAAANGNFIRLRMDSWWLAIDGPPAPKTGFRGPGWYNQEVCTIIDRIYEEAQRLGIYIMHCVDNANANVNDPKESWRRSWNLYLRDNGGPLQNMSDFWGDPTCERIFRNRLRYCVARWGAYRACMAWEFWNEVALRPNTAEACIAWHRRMAAWLRSIDPWRHLVTTSAMGDPKLLEKIWSVPELDIQQLHVYNRYDIAPFMADVLDRAVRIARRPFLFGEFGPDSRDGKMLCDPEGVGFHNGLWAPLFCGAAGTGAFWYTESYLDKRDLYHHFAPVARFAAGVPWSAPDLTPERLPDPEYAQLPEKLHYADLYVTPGDVDPFEKPPVTRFEVHPDGRISNRNYIRPYLHCSPARKAPPEFVIDCPRPTEFVVRVYRSVGDESNRLIIRTDGKVVCDRPFPAGKRFHPQSEYIERYDNWRTPYDSQVVVPLPAGRHIVRPEAVGKDRLEVRYSLRRYLCVERSRPVRAWAVRTRTSLWGWFQNRFSTYRTLYDHNQPPLLAQGMETTIEGLKPGTCVVQWFDSWQGRVLQNPQHLRADSAGRVRITLPAILHDVAVAITPEPAALDAPPPAQ